MPRGKHLPKASAKDNRQYEHILSSEMKRGRSKPTAKRIAAATVRKGQAAKRNSTFAEMLRGDVGYRQRLFAEEVMNYARGKDKTTEGRMRLIDAGLSAGIGPPRLKRLLAKSIGQKTAIRLVNMRIQQRTGKRNPSTKTKAKKALQTTGRALKSATRGVLAAGSQILGAGAKALNPSGQLHPYYADWKRKGETRWGNTSMINALSVADFKRRLREQYGTDIQIGQVRVATGKVYHQIARRKNKTTIKVKGAVIVAPNRSRTRNAYRIPPEAIAKFPQHMQDEYWKHWGDLEKREEKAATPKQRQAVAKAKRGFLSRLAVKARAFSQSRKYKVRARHLAKAPIKVIKVRSTSADGALAKAKAKLGSGYDQFKVQNKTVHRTGNPTFTIGARVKMGARKNISEGFWSGGTFHPIRSSSDYDPDRAGDTTGRSRSTRSKKAKVTKSKAAHTSRHRAAVKSRKATSSRLAGRSLKKSAGMLKKGRRNPSAKGTGKYSAAQRDKALARARRTGEPVLLAYWYEGWKGSEYRIDLWAMPDGSLQQKKRNPSAESIRKEFAGSVSGSRELFFPQGTPQGLAKLGKLVSIKTEEGTLKPVSGTAWLCADTNGHLHIGTTQNKPLWDGSAHSFGQVKEVEYEASKPHLGFPNPITFYHKLGEETGHKPTLRADGKGGLKFHGGRYRITREGIVN